MKYSPYQTANAGVYQTADAKLFLSDSGCRTFSNGQRRQETLFETADAGLFIRQQMQDPLY